MGVCMFVCLFLFLNKRYSECSSWRYCRLWRSNVVTVRCNWAWMASDSTDMSADSRHSQAAQVSATGFTMSAKKLRRYVCTLCAAELQDGMCWNNASCWRFWKFGSCAIACSPTLYSQNTPRFVDHTRCRQGWACQNSSLCAQIRWSPTPSPGAYPSPPWSATAVPWWAKRLVLWSFCTLNVFVFPFYVFFSIIPSRYIFLGLPNVLYECPLCAWGRAIHHSLTESSWADAYLPLHT